MSESMPGVFRNAVVVHANNHQFGPGQTVRQVQVESFMLVWCKGGTGRITVNQRPFELMPDIWVAMPWDHAVTYRAAVEDPFLVGGLHIVPDHSPDHPVVFTVAHDDASSVARCPWRGDFTGEEFQEPMCGSMPRSSSLRHLAESAVATFRNGTPREKPMRLLAQLILDALYDAKDVSLPEHANLPNPLYRALQYIENHTAAPLSIEELSAVSSRSPSALGRLFKKHLGVTPVEWITGQRMRYAKTLLAGSSLPIAQVGRRVGIDDPYYFSKRFKACTGLTPSDYRRHHSLV